MCLIIHKHPNLKIPHWLLESANEINDNGFGIAWRDSTTKKFHFFKTVCANWKDQLEVASLLLKHIGDETEAIIHFRMRTQGAIDEKNCHPIKIKSRHGNWLFFHNGHFRGFGDTVKSDTMEFAEIILSPLLENQKTLIPQMKTAIENLTAGNKIVLISPYGEIFKFPNDWYKLDNGIHLSNMYAWRNPKEKRQYGKSLDIICKADEWLLRKPNKHKEDYYYVIPKPKP